MTTATGTSELQAASLDELRARHEANDLRLRIWQQEQAQRALNTSRISEVMESYYDPSNYVDLRDYLHDGRSYNTPFVQPTSKNDREDGRNLPIFQTEHELAVIRGAARLLASCNGRVIGAMNNLANYIIGKGFDHKVSCPSDPKSKLAAKAQWLIDRFKKQNNWNTGFARELFIRSRRDGERFLGLWHIGGGNVAARAIEPDQVTEPGNKPGIEEWLACANPSSWSFGIHTDADDVMSTHGAYVQWSNQATDWDYLPGGSDPIVPPSGANTWIDHLKVNTDSNVKRGLSDLFSVQGTVELARKLLRNTGEGGALQAAIAWVREVMPGASRTDLEASMSTRADLTYQTRSANGGARTHYVTQYDPGTILTPSPGTKYTPGPMGSDRAPNFIQIEEALLRAIAVRWNMPEHMISGSAHNNNFASILVSGDPFVMAGEVEQSVYIGADERVMWKVLYFGWAAGHFGDMSWDDIVSQLVLDIKGPDIAVRDPKQETDRRAVLHEKRVLSRKTWATLESLDDEQEQTNFKEEGATPGDPVAANTTDAAAPNPDTGAGAGTGATTAANAGLQTELTLNGAQLTSAVEVLLNVSTGRLAEQAAIALLVGAGIDAIQARSIVAAQSRIPAPVVAQPTTPLTTTTPAEIAQ